MKNTALAILGLSLILASPLTAQSRQLSFAAGIAEFDLSGTGTEAAFEARYGHVLPGPLALDVGVGLIRPEQQFDERTTFVMSDVLVHLVRRSGRLRPYGGLGMGTAVDLRSDDFGGTNWRLATSAALGLRTPVGSSGALQLEGRLRMIGTGFNGSVAQLTLGWVQHF